MNGVLNVINSEYGIEEYSLSWVKEWITQTLPERNYYLSYSNN
jgi:hypothetical protein